MQVEVLTKRLTREPVFSVEFFPPKSEEAAGQLLRTAERLKPFHPDFVSITYGAGGGTRERTLKYARRLAEEFGYSVMPHLTCVGHSRAELEQIVGEFREAGIDQIMALRGDPPKGETAFKPHPDGLRYANELVALIREIFPECTIGVAGYPEKHPEAPDFGTDLANLKRKVEAGANFITTQLFFGNRHYYRFVGACRAAGIEVPVLPGLLTPTSAPQVRRFCALCGTTIPEELDRRLAEAGDEGEAVERVGIDWTLRQARELLARGAPGLHLYILNRAGPAIAMMDELKAAGLYQT
jgi:methylenetetrahydrofolate reductase (NADPH)